MRENRKILKKYGANKMKERPTMRQVNDRKFVLDSISILSKIY